MAVSGYIDTEKELDYKRKNSCSVDLQIKYLLALNLQRVIWILRTPQTQTQTYC